VPFGHNGGAVEQTFQSRDDLREAGLHYQRIAGIAGRPEVGAESIVMSGGYDDDLDLGDEIIYTGQGGRNPDSRSQDFDQPMTLGNAALVTSHREGLPIRVIRGARLASPFAPAAGYRYDGLYYVESYWPERPPAHGHLIWRYKLVHATGDGESYTAPPPPPPGAPPRVPTTIQRVVRSTEVARGVKEHHEHACQVCGETIQLPTGCYAEAAHIRPLGMPHNGPDTPVNVLCLCPSDHVRFDHGALVIESDWTIRDQSSGQSLGKLRRKTAHPIDAAHIEYHRARWTAP
jgi:predicted restriction endonuclease